MEGGGAQSTEPIDSTRDDIESLKVALRGLAQNHENLRLRIHQIHQFFLELDMLLSTYTNLFVL